VAQPVGKRVVIGDYALVSAVVGLISGVLAGAAVVLILQSPTVALRTGAVVFVAVALAVSALVSATWYAFSSTTRLFGVSPKDAGAALPEDLTGLVISYVGMRSSLSVGVWATTVVVGFVVVVALYAVVRFGTGVVALSTGIGAATGGGDAAAFAAVASVAQAISGQADRALLLLSALMAVLSLVGLLRIPLRPTVKDRTIAASVYLVLMVGWFSLVYYSGSVTHVLLFRVSEGDVDRVQELSAVDAVVLAISGLVGAGLGISPAGAWARIALGAELLGVAILVFWLAGREGSRDSPEDVREQSALVDPTPPVELPAPRAGTETADPAGLAFVWDEGIRLIETQLKAADELDDKIGRLITLVSAAAAVAFGVASAAQGPLVESRAQAQLLLVELLAVLVYLLLAFQTRGFAYAPALPALIPWASSRPALIQDAFVENLEAAYLLNLDAQSIKALYLRAGTIGLAIVGVSLVFMAMWSLR